MLTNKANLLFAVFVLTFSLPLANPASAENKTFLKEYTYLASDIDSKVSSRAIAPEQVKRALLEGSYPQLWMELTGPSGSELRSIEPTHKFKITASSLAKRCSPASENCKVS